MSGTLWERQSDPKTLRCKITIYNSLKKVYCQVNGSDGWNICDEGVYMHSK